MLYILSFPIYTTTALLIFSKNLVHFVLKLILIFFLVLVILLLFGVNCIDLLTQMIYGVIAILFLFIIRTLHLREESEYCPGHNIFLLFYAFFLLAPILVFVRGDFYFLILTDRSIIHLFNILNFCKRGL